MKTIKFLMIEGKPAHNLILDDYVSLDENGNVKVFSSSVDLSKIKDYVKDTVIWLTERKIQEKLKEKGFYSIGDLSIYKDKNDSDAIELYEWYLNFDKKIWDWIDELPNKTVEELLEIDLKALVESMSEEVDGN